MNDLKDNYNKDTLTKSDIKAIENKLISEFNSRFSTLVKRVTETPPKSIEEVQFITQEMYKVFDFGSNISNTMNSLAALELD